MYLQNYLAMLAICGSACAVAGQESQEFEESNAVEIVDSSSLEEGCDDGDDNRSDSENELDLLVSYSDEFDNPDTMDQWSCAISARGQSTSTRHPLILTLLLAGSDVGSQCI